MTRRLLFASLAAPFAGFKRLIATPTRKPYWAEVHRLMPLLTPNSAYESHVYIYGGPTSYDFMMTRPYLVTRKMAAMKIVEGKHIASMECHDCGAHWWSDKGHLCQQAAA